jgi:hypothetical protein
MSSGCGGGCKSSGPEALWKGTQFKRVIREFKSISYQVGADDRLTELAAQGWEVVDTSWGTHSVRVLLSRVVGVQTYTPKELP